MSDYSQTMRRFEKLRQTFERLIEENSYKRLREQIEKLKEQKKNLYEELGRLKDANDAHLRIIKRLEDKIEEDKKQVRAEDIQPAQTKES